MEFFKPGRHKEQFPKGKEDDQKTIEKDREKEAFLTSPISDAVSVRSGLAIASCFPEKDEPTFADILQCKAVAREDGYILVDKGTGAERVPMPPIGGKALLEVKAALRPYGLVLDVENQNRTEE